MATTNRFPGVCARCGARVPASRGSYLGKIDGKSTIVCAQHAVPDSGDQEIRPVVRIWMDDAPGASGTLACIRPTAFLGAELFEKLRLAVAGTRYAGDRKCSLATVAQIGAISARLSAAGFAIEADPDVVAAVRERDASTSADVAAAADRASQVDQMLRASGKGLFPFQWEGVEWLTSMFGAILADEMGLGKTVQALLSMPAGANVVVVCPKVAKPVWARECARWRPDLRPVVLSGRGTFRWPEAGELIVLNYAILPPEAEAKTLLATCPRGTVLVADEAHALQAGTGNGGSARAKSFSVLSQGVRDLGGRVWLVTGSPILNNQPEMWRMLRMIGGTGEVFGTYENFLELCGGRRGRFGVEWTGDVDPSVPGLLRRVMLRRLKKEVLPQMPEKIVEIVDVPLDEKILARTDRILAELAKAGVDVEAAIEMAKGARSRSDLSFRKISALRETLSQTKAAFAIEMIEELEEHGEPALVLSAHRASIDAIGSRPGWAAITGDTPDADREEIARSFQAGELKGIAGTIQAMGVAITLTRGCEGIVIDPLPVPDLNRQAEDRLHRIGQERTVRWRYLRVDHPLDRRFFEICEIKSGLVDRTVNASAVRVGEVAAREDASPFLISALAATADPEEVRAHQDALAAAIEEIRARRAKEGDEVARAESLRRAERAIGSRGLRVPVAELDAAPRGPRDAAEAWAAQAIRTLADGCDGAQTEDGAGFAKPDVGLGHALARSVPMGLSDGEWKIAIHICWYYPRQIGRPEEAGATRVDDQDGETTRNEAYPSD